MGGESARATIAPLVHKGGILFGTLMRAALQQNVAVAADLIVGMPHADSTQTAASIFVAF